MLAIEQYKKGTSSRGRAAELAGITIGEMIGVLAEYGVPSNLRMPSKGSVTTTQTLPTTPLSPCSTKTTPLTELHSTRTHFISR